MGEEGYRSSTGCERDSTIALIRLKTPFIDGNSEIKRMSHDKIVDPVVAKGISLAQDVVLHLLGESNVHLIKRDQLSLCLRNSVVEVLGKHAILFTSFAKRLARTPETTSEALLGVCDELFQNNSVTWSRIICLYALAGRLAMYFQEKNMHKLARSIPQHMTHCIARTVAPFVKRNGGWVRACFLKICMRGFVRGTICRTLIMKLMSVQFRKYCIIIVAMKILKKLALYSVILLNCVFCFYCLTPYFELDGYHAFSRENQRLKPKILL